MDVFLYSHSVIVYYNVELQLSSPSFFNCMEDQINMIENKNNNFACNVNRNWL